jgi:regulator of RNase E activity RraA
MQSALTPALFESLRRLDNPTLSNAIETFQARLRNEGFMTDHAVRCFFPALLPVLGYAATIKMRGSAPPTTAGLYADRTDWWNYILSPPSPRVAIQDEATHAGLGSLPGAVHINIPGALGWVAAVTNGVVRDLSSAEQIGFQLFAAGVTVDFCLEKLLAMVAAESS